MDPRNLDPSSPEERTRKMLNSTKGWNLVADDIPLADGVTTSVDGIDHKRRIIVEIFAWSGAHTSARDDKVVAEAAKLMLIRKRLKGEWRSFVVFCGTPAAAQFQMGLNAHGVQKWASLALREFEVEPIDVDLSTHSV